MAFEHGLLLFLCGIYPFLQMEFHSLGPFVAAGERIG